MTATRIQLRGHCQCCGRVQAVPTAFMSKHGYKVEDGWFNGVCSGERFKPLEQERTQADQIAASVRAQCVAIDKRLASLLAGEWHPDMVRTNRWDPVKREPVQINWDEADDYQKRQEVESTASNMRARAASGRRFADDLMKLADEVFGKPLQEVNVEANKPAPVFVGEQRMWRDKPVTAIRVERGKVKFRSELRVFEFSLQRWRAMPLAFPETDATIKASNQENAK